MNNLKNTYLNDDIRIKLVESYLIHEYKKLQYPTESEINNKINNFKESKVNINSSLFISFIDNTSNSFFCVLNLLITNLLFNISL